MAKLKFKDENNEFIPVVQDVTVNGSSVFNGKNADVFLKTINNQSIVGSGNIDGGLVDDVKVNGSSVVENKVANITIPTNVSAFNNDAGYLTLSTLPIYNGGVE